jgi:hypothetical protein
MDIPAERLAICLEVLHQIADDPKSIAHHDQIKGLIAKIHQQGRKYSRKNDRTEIANIDRYFRMGSISDD